MLNPLKKAIIHFRKFIFSGKIEGNGEIQRQDAPESELFEKVLGENNRRLRLFH